MSSNINYLSINENFPVAGQDNDTQTFRDNFDTIKTSLREAKTEIEDLQDNVARVDEPNTDFNLNKVVNAVLDRNRSIAKGPTQPSTSTATIDFELGSYQTFKIGMNTAFEITKFPGDPALTDPVSLDGVNTIGKVTIELYKNTSGSDPVITFTTSGSGATTVKKNANFPATLTLTSTNNPVIIEIWRHTVDNSIIFMNYLGEFS